MKRLFFDLEGDTNVSDPGGQLFNSELEAVLAARRLAEELAGYRADLRGKASIIVLKKDQRKYCQVPI
jgi:hypothetical protein